MIVSGGEVANRLNQLLKTSEAGIFQSFALKNAKPDFNLIESTGARRCEVKGDVGVCSQLFLILLVSACCGLI